MHATVNQRPAIVVLLGADTQSRNNDATRLFSWLNQLPKNI